MICWKHRLNEANNEAMARLELDLAQAHQVRDFTTVNDVVKGVAKATTHVGGRGGGVVVEGLVEQAAQLQNKEVNDGGWSERHW